MSAAEASTRATQSKDTIRNWQRAAKKNPNSAPNLQSLAKVAEVLKTSTTWLAEGTGPENLTPVATVRDVPMISWVSAGEMLDQEAIGSLTDFPTITAVDLPEGDWVALRVDGPSMNKISPPESIIFVNLRDKRLVPNACYVIADETGRATYKRYRPTETPHFQPASYEDIAPPTLNGAIKVVGRVRRSSIDM